MNRFNPHCLTKTERAVYNAIKSGSKETPRTRKWIAEVTGLTDRHVREIKRNLIIVYKLPIETAPGGGYYMARRNARLTSAARDLKQGVQTIITARVKMQLSDDALIKRIQAQLDLQKAQR